MRSKLWRAFEAAWHPSQVRELVLNLQGQPGVTQPSGLTFFDPNGAIVDLGPWKPVDHDRWELRLPLRPLFRRYRPESSTDSK